jgi:hypothetical protein
MKEKHGGLTNIALLPLGLTVLLLLWSCTSSQFSRTIDDVSGIIGAEKLTTEDVIGGLKEALEQGARIAADEASVEDGYFGNAEIRIPFPPEIEKVESTLRDIGLDREVDRFILSMNRAAEQAADRALDIFVSAIRSMTIEDAWNILMGEDDAATQYLKRTTSPELFAAFQPVVKDALDLVHATRYYSDIIQLYNSLPFVQQVNPNLDEYVTLKAMDGLFILIAREEALIREDPIARTTELMRRVFSEQD